jgi:integrase
MIRRFAQYRKATDPRTEIPPQELLPYCYRRKKPYIYTDGEIKKLLKAAKKLPSKIGLEPYTYSTLIGLIAITGMRISESINLNDDDVDMVQGVLVICGTKFGKTRLVPIHSSTQGKLRQYAHRRDRMHLNRKDKSFFVSDSGTRLNEQAVRRRFVKLSRQIGLRSLSDRYGPRLHDLRHAFAIRTIVAWYRRGVDVEQRLPQLSTYLGHVEVTNTYWYLSVTPELLRLAAMRLDHTKGELL